MADLSKLDKAINELDSQSKEIAVINKVLTEIGTLNKGLSKNISTLEKHNNSFVAVTDALSTSVKEKSLKITAKLEELFAENKKFYKELDALLHSLLEKHMSDIQVEVRNESQQLRKEFKEVQENTERSLIAVETISKESSEKQIKATRTVLIITSILLVSNILLALKILGFI